MKKQFIYILAIAFLALGCNQEETPQNTLPQAGNWDFSFQLKEDVSLDLMGDISLEGDTWNMRLDNGGEYIVMDAVEFSGDTMRAQMPVFLSYIEGTLTSPTEWSGFFYAPSRGPDYKIPFTAKLGDGVPVTPEGSDVTLAPKWETTFSPGTDDAYPAIGEFTVEDGFVKGTFLTETGDYRFLHGKFEDRRLLIKTFDGSHLFVFDAKLNEEGKLEGMFYSGNHWEENWVATPNPDAKLRAPDELTVLKEGYERFEFAFPDVNGNMVSFPSEKYEGKPVVIQILGSWCPNCMDETRLFTQWHNTYHEQGLEIIGLAFERSESTAGIERMKESMEVPYEILMASSTTSKKTAGEKLPMLNHVLSYPTSIWIGKDGSIRKIHTGFNGPGTGEPYQEFVTEYQGLIEKMLGE